MIPSNFFCFIYYEAKLLFCGHLFIGLSFTAKKSATHSFFSYPHIKKSEVDIYFLTSLLPTQKELDIHFCACSFTEKFTQELTSLLPPTEKMSQVCISLPSSYRKSKLEIYFPLQKRWTRHLLYSMKCQILTTFSFVQRKSARHSPFFSLPQKKSARYASLLSQRKWTKHSVFNLPHRKVSQTFIFLFPYRKSELGDPLGRQGGCRSTWTIP